MSGRIRKEGPAEEAVLSLQLDSSTVGLEPREVDGDAIAGFQTPCTLKGLSAGASGGALGFVFGFGAQRGHRGFCLGSATRLVCLPACLATATMPFPLSFAIRRVLVQPTVERQPPRLVV